MQYKIQVRVIYPSFFTFDKQFKLKKTFLHQRKKMKKKKTFDGNVKKMVCVGIK